MHRWIEKKRNWCLALTLKAIGDVCGPLRLAKVYQRLIARFVARTGLFDALFYTRNNPDVVVAGYDPLLHYVAYGDRENRLPMPLFDPAHYRSSAGRHSPGSLNALVHYALVGRYAGIETSPWFNTAYYLAENRDVKFKGVDPLLHFLQHGGREGRSPSETFDSARYLLAHPDVAAAGLNPLLHHLDCVAIPCESKRDIAACTMLGHPNTTAPTAKAWNALLPLPARPSAPVVDVIVPVYKGRSETLRCLYNVLALRQKTPFEAVVVDDASPDPALVADLKRLRSVHGFTLLQNEKNLGYVRSVNLAMQLHPGRDVLLLNSDTQPNNDWLDRLRAAAYLAPRIGTVTPLSNNATICSYPLSDHDNPCPLEVSSAELDRIARKVNAGRVVESPTAVGFCMYIKRRCLDEVGLFDETAFGQGYGEENDFCRRAIRKRWKHIVATNVFVWHWGARSFKGLKGRRVKKAISVLKRRYPSYLADVSAFVHQDPLRAARRRIDEARLADPSSELNVLIVKHNRGGGTEKSIREMARSLRGRGAVLFYLTPAAEEHCARISSDRVTHLPNLDAVDFRQPDSFFRVLKRYRIHEIHVHQLIDFGKFAPRVLASCANGAGLRLEVFVHDYQSICPRINLVNATGIYCGEPEERQCNSCIRKTRSSPPIGLPVDIRTWRRRHGRLLSAASVVNVPNRDVKLRLRNWFSDCRITVSPPETLELPDPRRFRRPLRYGEPLRIVVVGAIVPIKGFYVLKECARDAKKRSLPITYSVMGFTKNDKVLSDLGVAVTGRYNDKESVELLRSLTPHLVWLPSIWPETYSYTLSLALLAGFDVVAFDLGAIARRLRAFGREDHLQPLGWAKQPTRINASFLEIRKQKMVRQEDARLSTVAPIQVLS